MEIVIAIQIVNLHPDTSALAAWLVSESLAWFLSASTLHLALGVWGLTVVVAGVLVWVERGLK